MGVDEGLAVAGEFAGERYVEGVQYRLTRNSHVKLTDGTFAKVADLRAGDDVVMPIETR